MDKKNTLLLTVIAIATLLVAVVGATFAYFSAQTGDPKDATFEVKTNNKDTVTYSAIDPIYIIANADNFQNVTTSGESGETGKVGSQKATAKATVEYLQGDAASKGICYNVTLKVTTNSFKYAPLGTDFKSDPDNKDTREDYENAPELLLKLTKQTKKGTLGSDALSPVETQNYKAELTTETTVKYVSLTGKQRRVCTQDHKSSNSVEKVDSYSCEDEQTLEGYDITELAQEANIKIPVKDTESSNFTHKLKGDAANDKMVDEWTIELIFVNYDWDQQYNVGKTFSATLDFENDLSCS